MTTQGEAVLGGAVRRAARRLDSGFCHLGALLGGSREPGRKRMGGGRLMGVGEGRCWPPLVRLWGTKRNVWGANTGGGSQTEALPVSELE